MNEILRELLEGEYDPMPEWDEEQRALGKKLCAEWDKVRTIFGDEFIDRLMGLEGERSDWLAFRYYRASFRLGAQLMLAALDA